MGRRWQATEIERQWRKEEQIHALATRRGYQVMRRGLAKDD